jgi:hypothetical protein
MSTNTDKDSNINLFVFLVSVVVEQGGVQPDEVKYLNDNFTETCSNFVTNRRQHTQLFKERYCDVNKMTVTVVGREMGCGQGLYLVGLTKPDVGKPLNRWKMCKLNMEATTEDKVEWCSYDCDCSGGCEQVMLLRWPNMALNTSWTLCDISEHCNGKMTLLD